MGRPVSFANILKHSRATYVSVKLHFIRQRIILSVSDNGVGVHDHQDTTGIGLIGLRERTGVLGGEALSVSAAYPDLSTFVLAQKMAASDSSFRNLLSGAYRRFRVSTRTAVIVRANQLGLLANANDGPGLSK
jgi:nitrate/nitrite-specific signal transduction histidine kinase